MSPYPARVYENAPPGVPVLTVNAYDNETAEQVTNFRLKDYGDPSYFRITSDGIMETRKRVEQPIGYEFRFFVFAVHKNNVSCESVQLRNKKQVKGSCSSHKGASGGNIMLCLISCYSLFADL